jgi:hypothetical protein
MVFASERDGSDGALDWVVVEFDTTVIEEAGEGGPAPERVADGLGFVSLTLFVTLTRARLLNSKSRI